jgi:hypothetical protein
LKQAIVVDAEATVVDAAVEALIQVVVVVVVFFLLPKLKKYASWLMFQIVEAATTAVG